MSCTIWFTSDLHFNHANIIQYSKRPFKSVDEMNEELINRYNFVVNPNDQVYLLGDLSMNLERAKPYLRRLNGKKNLILGNHDEAHPVHHKGKKDPKRWIQEYLDLGFETVELEAVMTIAGLPCKLAHMPYAEDHSDGIPRYLKHRPVDDGGWLLHGHVHDLWKIRSKQINVGVDVWDYGPVSIETIQGILTGKSG
jgi:calcineurin-like phosphoesterase family protein